MKKLPIGQNLQRTKKANCRTYGTYQRKDDGRVAENALAIAEGDECAGAKKQGSKEEDNNE